jgi:hypothetical protein
MKLDELSLEQRNELKYALLMERQDSVSMNEYLNVGNLVTDEELEAKWGDTEFVEDDFAAAHDPFGDGETPF